MENNPDRKKRILIVSGTFYPAISPRAYRTTELAKELARQGHDVLVCFPTHDRDYSLFEINNKLKILNLGHLRWKGIILKGGRLELVVRRALRRGLQLFFEWPAIEIMFRVAGILKQKKGFDLLISIAVPHPVHWGVALVRNRNRIIAKTWIADCGDPYMGDKTDSFQKVFYFKYVEKWFCRKADFITIPFEGARSAYYTEFQNKIRIIPQGFNLDDLKIPHYTKKTEYPVFAYAGGFIPGRRDPRPMLNFLTKQNKRFLFIVFTSMTDLVFPYKVILGDKLIIREYIPREELLHELVGMDFLVNFDNNASTQLPSKLIDYAITGRPVLNINTGDDFSLLLEFMDGNYGGRMDLEPSESYNIKLVAKKFTSLCSTD